MNRFPPQSVVEASKRGITSNSPILKYLEENEDTSGGSVIETSRAGISSALSSKMGVSIASILATERKVAGPWHVFSVTDAG
jgi:hypothetical protein